MSSLQVSFRQTGQCSPVCRVQVNGMFNKYKGELIVPAAKLLLNNIKER